MLLTEEEAKEKWCPHARASDQADPPSPINRVRTNKPDADCLCVGSACMAWRWGEPGIGHRQGAAVNPPSDDYERQGDYFVRVRESCRRGYCGAFGKPEVA